MEIIFKIDTNRPMSEKDKFFISFLNNIYNGKKTLDQILDEDQEDEKSEADETRTPPEPTKETEEPEETDDEPEPDEPKPRKFKEKICRDCKEKFTPMSGRSVYCDRCRPKHRRGGRKEAPAPKVKIKPKPEPPKTVACRNCHKQYIPEPGDGNLYCPKCLDKLRNRPKLTPLKTNALSLTVEEVMKLPVVDRYKYAYMWTYQERQRALAMKPIYPKPSKEEEEFFRRCATGDFMED